MFWLILMASTAWKVILAWKLDICYDEGHYFFWALFPQLSYFDHPPLTAWAMTLIYPVFGDSIWTVRFWPLVVGVLFPLVGRQLGRQIFDDAIGNRAGIFLTLCPVFFGNGFLMTPDTLMAMFWALAVWATSQALRQTSPAVRWWLAAGVFAGMGLLSKYTMVLYFLGLGALFALMPGKRKNLFWGALLSGIVALLMFSPVIIWNLEHDWVSFRYQLRHGFDGSRGQAWKTFPEYLGVLLLVATPLLGGLAFWRSFQGVFSKREEKRFLAAFFWIVVLFFANSSLTSKVEANWPMPAFFSGILLVAADWQELGSGLRRATAGLLLAVVVVALVYASLPAGVGISLAGRSMDISRLEEFAGGEELAILVRESMNKWDLDFICSQKEIILGEIAFYAPDLRPRLLIVGSREERLPWLDHHRWQGQNALLVSAKPRDWPWFKEVRPIGRFELPVRRYLARVIFLAEGIHYQADHP